MQPICISKKKITMPTNLDALIRYKTMDQCFATGRRYTLEELANRCSEALSEKSGYTRSVSTRTIQDDIRVMRGDMLAFNAPIEVKDGLYFYSNPGEYVYRKNISNHNDLKKIMAVLVDILKETKSRELFYVIRKLDRLTQAGISSDLGIELGLEEESDLRLRLSPYSRGKVPSFEEPDYIDVFEIVKEPEKPIEQKTVFCWEEVIKIL